LGLPQAEAMVECIRDELKKVDPLRAEGYQKRAADYIVQLQKLHQEGRDRLAGKKEHSLVSFHNSLHYFAKSFGLSIAGVIQTRPGASGDPGTLGDLLKICKEKGVRIIATEPQFRQTAAAQTLLKEMQLRGVPDAQIIEIDTLETVSPEETLDTGWYVRRLRANLDTLAAELR
jgi:ABC-type Zn uptake system ZnuABC Zn-binding protein ZnuA